MSRIKNENKPETSSPGTPKKGPAVRRRQAKPPADSRDHTSNQPVNANPEYDPEADTDVINLSFKPELLAPAGDMQCALAAFAAGADAVYLGLKHFSARMLAENFSTTDLARLAELAHQEGRKIYVAMNTLVKPDETASAYRLIRRLALDVKPDALIIQDPGIISLARQADFRGEIHLSTLANVTHQKALETAADLGASRVIVPRELSIDELRLMNDACPQKVELEMFVHGALCYCVSGRCWWSSYMGGKSGLRGRCVQPCRRVYTQKGKKGRFFSCLDLSLDALVKTILRLPRVVSWKIEGRRKGPHYVYYATTAYRILRDNPNDSKARKEALNILEMSLGRPGTKSLFLPQHAESPVSLDGQTSSGLLCGKLGKGLGGKYEFKPRLPLLPNDYMRVGYEDETWHHMVSVTKWVPEGGNYTITMPRGKNPPPGAPVFLIDRKEKELMELISSWDKRLKAVNPAMPSRDADIAALSPKDPLPAPQARKLEIIVRSSLPHGRDGKAGLKPGRVQGLWLSPRAVDGISQTLFDRLSWWLPPVIWPDEEDSWARLINRALRNGGRHFVCNSPWQAAYFKDRKGLALTAGPFCNIANPHSLGILAELGFNSAIISPELGEADILDLPAQSPMPLGIVVSGYFPVGISRHSLSALKIKDGFQSPKGEEFWAKQYGRNLWIYPAWPLDLSEHRARLEQAGYTTFVELTDYPPKDMAEAKRTSEFNWKIDVL